ncbi:unnamed protein product [Trichogramma brassicae]|uniref:Uncharacterized protein n=1 Tax=Trichogramma brassicae TaxID=86971 RepID=A0A6H5HWP3_9HYME|nr:unnamed protein product [Trichogramma brassicae]
MEDSGIDSDPKITAHMDDDNAYAAGDSSSISSDDDHPHHHHATALRPVGSLQQKFTTKQLQRKLEARIEQAKRIQRNSKYTKLPDQEPMDARQSSSQAEPSGSQLIPIKKLPMPMKKKKHNALVEIWHSDSDSRKEADAAATATSASATTAAAAQHDRRFQHRGDERGRRKRGLATSGLRFGAAQQARRLLRWLFGLQLPCHGLPELVSCLTLRNFIFMPLGPTRAAWLNATIFRENFANASRIARPTVSQRARPSVMPAARGAYQQPHDARERERKEEQRSCYCCCSCTACRTRRYQLSTGACRREQISRPIRARLHSTAGGPVVLATASNGAGALAAAAAQNNSAGDQQQQLPSTTPSTPSQQQQQQQQQQEQPQSTQSQQQQQQTSAQQKSASKKPELPLQLPLQVGLQNQYAAPAQSSSSQTTTTTQQQRQFSPPQDGGAIDPGAVTWSSHSSRYRDRALSMRSLHRRVSHPIFIPAVYNIKELKKKERAKSSAEHRPTKAKQKPSQWRALRQVAYVTRRRRQRRREVQATQLRVVRPRSAQYLHSFSRAREIERKRERESEKFNIIHTPKCKNQF